MRPITRCFLAHTYVQTDRQTGRQSGRQKYIHTCSVSWSCASLYMHACMHTSCIYSSIHLYIHTYTRACMHANIRIHIHSNLRTSPHGGCPIHTYIIHTYILTYIHTSRMHINMHTNSYKPADLRKRHTYILTIRTYMHPYVHACRRELIREKERRSRRMPMWFSCQKSCTRHINSLQAMLNPKALRAFDTYIHMHAYIHIHR